MKKLLLIGAFAAFVLTPVLALVSPQPAYADDAAQTAEDAACEKRLLTFPTWYRGLSAIDNRGQCSVKSPDAMNTAPAGEPSNGLSNFIWRIVLNIIEIGLQIVAYIAVAFVLYGGFQFLTGGANPGQVEKARVTILNAVIGLAISMASIAIVNLIFGVLN